MSRIKSMFSRAVLAAIVCVLCALNQAQADLIEVDQGEYNFRAAVYSQGPAGQSFTAEDTLISYIGLGIEDVNPGNPLVPLHATLYEGSGDGGSVLGTLDVTPDAGVSWQTDMVHFDFSSVTFTVGQVYTILVTTDNYRWGIDAYRSSYDGGSDLYTGGQFFLNGVPHPGDGNAYDARFRVVPAAVPIPGAALLAALGLGVVGLIKRDELYR